MEISTYPGLLVTPLTPAPEDDVFGSTPPRPVPVDVTSVAKRDDGCEEPVEVESEPK